MMKAIPGYPGFFASVEGRIYRDHAKHGMIEASYDPNSRGYQRAWVVDEDGERKRKMVHNLVWTAHNGPIPEGYEVDHKKGKMDNRLADLQLLTRAQNRSWFRKEYKKRDPVTYVLKKPSWRRREVKIVGMSEVARFLGVSLGAVYHTVEGYQHTCGGYIIREAV